MTKKEFKKLKKGDELVVTGAAFGNHYPLGEIVEVEHVNKIRETVTCISTCDGLRQHLGRKELTPARRRK